MKVVFRNILVLFLMCWVVGFLLIYKNNTILLSDTPSSNKKTIKHEKANIEQAIPDVNNINDSYVIHVLEKEGIKLSKSNHKLEDKYILKDIKPTIYEFQGIENEYLYVYVFKSLHDRKQLTSDFTFELQKTEEMGVYTARNVLMLLEQQKSKSLQSFIRRQQFGEAVFDKLNNAKEMVFKADGEFWDATYKVRYFEYFMKSTNGRLSYDSFCYTDGELTYKGENTGQVGKINYVYDRGSGTGFTLNKEGKTKFGQGGGNGTVFRKNDVITLKVEWDGNQEILKLRSK